MIEHRRHIHRHPELSFQEEQTSGYIAAVLENLGVEHRTGVAGNGIVGVIHGSADRTAGDSCIALRADIDALPITEATNLPYASENPGVMHACGHDVHTGALLGAARVLQELRTELPGDVKLLFQPAEETLPGGAAAMIAEGALEQPRAAAVIGEHVNPELPAGVVGMRPGLFMASADEIYITITGRGGHAAKPHLGVDPVAVAADLVVTLQQIVSRRADPTVPSVLTVGRFIADGQANVIPDTVELAATLRTVEEGWRDRALELITSSAEQLCAALGARAEVRINRGYPPLHNDPSLTERVHGYAEDYLGEGRVVELPPAMWAEDFAYYGADRPACFYNLGVGNAEVGAVHGVHTSQFTVDESAIALGAGLIAWMAFRELKSSLRRVKS